MTRREREEELLLLVQQMDRLTWAYERSVVQAAHSAYDTLKLLPEGPQFDAMEGVVRSLHGHTTPTLNILVGLSYFGLGLFVTYPWWKAGR